MPAPAWKDIAARTYKRVWDDNVGLVAAGVAFYGFFALLSLLGLIVLSYGLVTDPHTVIEHMRALTAVLPTDVALVIGDQLMTAVKSSEGTKGWGILLAFLVAVYGGTNGAAAIITGRTPGRSVGTAAHPPSSETICSTTRAAASPLSAARFTKARTSRKVASARST